MIHSYPWYIKDWLLSESRLTMTLAQRGLYRDLLDHFFDQGSLPSNEAAIFRMASCSMKEFRSAWPVVRSKFEERNGRLYNTKAEEVLASKVSRQVKNALAGSSGGLAKQRNAYVANAKQMLSECLPDAKQTSSNGSSKTLALDVAHGRARSPSPSPSITPPTPSKLLGQTSQVEESVQQIFERIIARHKSNYFHTMKIQSIAQQWISALSTRPDDPIGFARSIDEAHSKACETEQWKGKYRRGLEKWLAECGWMDEYPTSNGDVDYPT